MKRILISALLALITLLPASAQKKYPTPFKTAGGLYGFTTRDSNSKAWPQFSYAGKFTNGVAPVSFDNYNYALTNEFNCIATEFCFKGIPELTQSLLVIVKDPQGNGYLADLQGNQLTPTIKNIDFSHGVLIGRDSISGRKVIYRPDLSILPGSERYEYGFSNIHVNLADSTYIFHILEGSDDPNTRNRYIMSSATDAAGNSIFPDGLCCFEPMVNYNHIKAIDKKLFVDNGVDISMKGLFFTAHKNGKVGLYFIDGSEILPPIYKNEEKVMKQFAKDFKKKIAPRFKSGELYEAAINTLNRLNQTELESGKSYAAALIPNVDSIPAFNPYATVYSPSISVKTETLKTPTKTTKGKKGKKVKKTSAKTVYRFDPGFGTTSKVGEPIFDEVIDHGIYFFCKKQGEKKYHLYNAYGIQMTIDPYDEIQPWGFNKDNEQRFRVRDGELWGVIDLLGRELLSPQFSEIPMGSADDDAIVAIRDGKYYLIAFNHPRFVNGVPYDFIQSFDIKGKHEASRLGYKTEVDEFGKEHPSIATVAYNEACNTEMSPEDKVLAFANVIELCESGDKEILGFAYNNMGYYYQEAGDLENAKIFYRKAAENGNPKGSANLQALMAPANSNSNNTGSSGGGNWLSTLGQIANALAQMSGNSTTGGFFNGLTGGGMAAGDSYGGSYDSGSSSSAGSGSNVNPSYYTDTYARWERNAKSCYDSLTLQGSQTTRNGKAESGTHNNFWGHHTAGLKRNLRNAQSQMRKIRQEARRAGVNITQSNYETVTVN